MRVLYSFPHRLGSPGIGCTAAAQVRGLIALGVHVALFCTSLIGEIPRAEHVEQTMMLGGTRVPHRAVGMERAWIYHDWRVARSLRRLASEVDLVHVWPLASVQTLRTARQLGIPGVREVPNTHTEFAYLRAAREAADLRLTMPRNHSHRPSPIRLAREKTEYELAARLLVPSDYVRQTFLDRGFPPERLARHQYGYDPTRFPPPERPTAPPPDQGLRAAFVGHGEPRKGLHHALHAWLASGASERGTFEVCGSMLPGYADRLQDALAHPSVTVRGFVDDVPAVLRDADVLVLPSVEEGSALVTYEAQASGCALVVSDAAGALCRHPDQGLVHAAGDVATLTQHLRMLDTDRALLARLQSTALSRRDELTWDRAAQRLVEIYRQCVDGAVAPS